MKIAVEFPDLLHIGIQPVIEHNLNIDLISISKKEFLPFSFTEPVFSLEDSTAISATSGADFFISLFNP